MRLINGAVVGWIAILLLASSCELSELGDPIVVSNVEDEFEIIPWEKLSPEGRSFELILQTKSTQDCINAAVRNQLRINGNQISLSIQEIAPQGDCDPGVAPATGTANLGSLSPRFYKLSVDLKNTVFNEGQLGVFTNRYVIDMESTDGFDIAYNELRRVPQQSIWGYVTYQDVDSKNAADALVSTIEALSVTRSFPSGNYGYFQVAGGSSSTLSVKDHPDTSNIHQFLYQYEGDLADLERIIGDYREQYSEQLDISLFTWTGEEF